MVDIEVVIQELESAANEAVADVQNEINEKRRLEDENKKLQVSHFIRKSVLPLEKTILFLIKKTQFKIHVPDFWYLGRAGYANAKTRK